MALINTYDLTTPVLTDDTGIFKNNWQPRLLFVNSIDISGLLYGMDYTKSDNPYINKWNTLSTFSSPDIYNDNTYSLLFNSEYSYIDTSLNTNNTLYKKFYQSDIEGILSDDARLLKCKMYLTEDDIQQIDFATTVYIKNKDIGEAYYHINSIKYNGEYSEVELIKLNYYQQDTSNYIDNILITKSTIGVTNPASSGSVSGNAASVSVDTTIFMTKNAAKNAYLMDLPLNTQESSTLLTYDIPTNALQVNANTYSAGDVYAFASDPAPSSWWDSMPIASATILGGVKQGTGITIDANGVINASIAGGVGTVNWGSIGGSISNQVDLTAALNLRPTYTYVDGSLSARDTSIAWLNANKQATGNYWAYSGSWKPASLSAATRQIGITSPDDGEFALAYVGGQTYPYCDGFFYQNEGAYRVIDESDARLTDARTPASHNNTYHSETYITASALSPYAPLSNPDFLGNIELTHASNPYFRLSKTDSTARIFDIQISNDDLYFTDATASAHRLFIEGGTGNVGFGTTSPGYNLEVKGDGTTSTVFLNGTNAIASFGESTTFLGRCGGTSYHITGSAAGDMAMRSTSGYKLHLGTGTVQGLTIAEGNVGIGTTAPGRALHIKTGTNSYGSMRVESTTTGEAGINYRDSAGSDGASWTVGKGTGGIGDSFGWYWGANQLTLSTGGNLTALGAMTATQLTSNIADGTAPIVVTSTTKVNNLHVARATLADTVTVSGTSDTTCSVALFESATGNMEPKTSAGITYNATNGTFSCTGDIIAYSS